MNWENVRQEVSDMAGNHFEKGGQIDTIFLGAEQIRAFLQSPDCRFNQFVPHPKEMTTIEGVKIVEVLMPNYLGFGTSVSQ